jgi:hypothetical protein
MSHAEIAEGVAEWLVTSGWANTEPTLVGSAEVQPDDAGLFDTTTEAISFQSENDVALVFSGEFTNEAPALILSTSTYDYLLVLVDTDHGYPWLWLPSDHLAELTDRLP